MLLLRHYRDILAYARPLFRSISTIRCLDGISSSGRLALVTATATGIASTWLAATEPSGTPAAYLDAPLSNDLLLRLKDSDDMQAKMEDMVLQAQAVFVRALTEENGGQGSFRIDRHERQNGEGGGITAVLQDSDVFEKAGVNVSVIRGNLKPELAKQMSSRGKEVGFIQLMLCTPTYFRDDMPPPFLLMKEGRLIDLFLN